MTKNRCDIYYPESLDKEKNQESYIFESKQLITIIDIISDKHYLFIGTYLGIGLIIDKINKSGLKSLTSEERKKIQEKYTNIDLDKIITSKTILIKDFINSDDTILTLKKKIMTFINPLSIPNKQHLWIDKDTSTEALGFEYNNGSKLDLKCDLTQTKVLTKLKPIDFSYNFYNSAYFSSVFFMTS